MKLYYYTSHGILTRLTYLLRSLRGIIREYNTSLNNKTPFLNTLNEFQQKGTRAYSFTTIVCTKQSNCYAGGHTPVHDVFHWGIPHQLPRSDTPLWMKCRPLFDWSPIQPLIWQIENSKWSRRRCQSIDAHSQKTTWRYAVFTR
jgi:hypothetical protein